MPTHRACSKKRSYTSRLRSLKFENLEERSLLATYTVAVLNDSSTPFGTAQNPQHTLRSAIIAANANPNVGGPDVVQFASGLSGPVNVVNGPMTITDNIQITGPSGSVTFNAGTTTQTSAIQFSITSSATTTSTVSGLQFVGFDSGIKIASVPDQH